MVFCLNVEKNMLNTATTLMSVKEINVLERLVNSHLSVPEDNFVKALKTIIEVEGVRVEHSI